MATEHAMAIMENDANKRIDAALSVITAELGVEIPVVVPERLDPRMKGIRVIEHHADVLDVIADALTAPKPAPQPTSATQTNDKPVKDATPAKAKDAA